MSIRALVASAAIATSLIGFHATADGDVVLTASGVGAGGLMMSYSPYVECPAGDYPGS
jgi:hypothetical protein